MDGTTPGRSRSTTSLQYLGDFATKGYLLRGLSLVQQKRLGDAREALEKAVEFDETLGQAWFWLGIVLQRLGEGRDARPAYAKVARLLKSPHHGKVACPECGWIPCGDAMWTCDACK